MDPVANSFKRARSTGKTMSMSWYRILLGFYYNYSSGYYFSHIHTHREREGGGGREREALAFNCSIEGRKEMFYLTTHSKH